MNDTPKPGSHEARAQGCKCPMFRNSFGRGVGGDGRKNGWELSTDCAMHYVDMAALANRLMQQWMALHASEPIADNS